MSYNAIEKQRILDQAQQNVEQARGKLEEALRGLASTDVPKYIGFPDGLDDRLIIRNTSHRLAIGNLLRSFIATNSRQYEEGTAAEVKEEKDKAKKVLLGMEELNHAEKTKKAINENEIDSERGGMAANG